MIEKQGNDIIEEKKSKVALVRCSSYKREDVEHAVTTAINLLGGFEEIFAGDENIPEITVESELVLKPNLLAKASPEKAVTTHPEVFRAVGKALQEAGYKNLKYGDSPGNPMLSVSRTAEGCGIKTVADELGIEAGDFEHGTEIEFPEGRAAKHFVICNEVAKVIGAGGETPAGAVINICKMKTHQLERITGAVKNTFGCVYGVNKTASHAKFASPEHFAKMIADLNLLVRPRLHIMDGIVAMEGNGPGSGDPLQMYVLIASTDPVAVDTTFCKLINLDADLVPTNTAAAEAGVGKMDDDGIEVLLGDMPMQKEGAEILMDDISVKYGNSMFKVQRGREYRGSFRIMNILGRLIEKKPIILEDKCIGCGICVESCPVEGKAIALRPRITAVLSETSGGTGMSRSLSEEEGVPKGRVALYNYSKCIKCYCCQEMCPEKAIIVHKSLIAKIIDRKWKM